MDPEQRPSLSMSAPDITEAEVEAVAQVVRSGRLALGPQTLAFEESIADYVGAKHGVACSSGTAALHMMVRSLGLGPGDEVLVPSFTFAASVNAILFERAEPVFVDIEPDTFNLDPEDLAAKITDRTRAICTVDVFGHPVDFNRILPLAAAHKLAILDDSCEALGASYHGKRVGSFGDASCFGFYPNKQITTGEGGIVITDSDSIAAQCRSLRNQGRGAMGSWLHHEQLGYNYRLDEMSAALGVVQMERLPEILAGRQRVATLYADRLEDIEGLRIPTVKPGVEMSWFVYVITLDPGIDRDEVMRSLEAQGVPVRAYFDPIHLQPYIRSQPSYATIELPVTASVAARTIALPFHTGLDASDVDYVGQMLENAISQQRSAHGPG